jgi:hypothetical protein
MQNGSEFPSSTLLTKGVLSESFQPCDASIAGTSLAQTVQTFKEQLLEYYSPKALEQLLLSMGGDKNRFELEKGVLIISKISKKPEKTEVEISSNTLIPILALRSFLGKEAFRMTYSFAK